MVEIYRLDIFLQVCRLAHVKRERKNPTQTLVTIRTGREVPDLLRELYVGKRHSQQEIADALDVSRAQVQYWLQQFGISRDDRAPVEIEAAS